MVALQAAACKSVRKSPRPVRRGTSVPKGKKSSMFSSICPTLSPQPYSRSRNGRRFTAKTCSATWGSLLTTGRSVTRKTPQK